MNPGEAIMGEAGSLKVGDEKVLLCNSASVRSGQTVLEVNRSDDVVLERSGVGSTV